MLPENVQVYVRVSPLFEHEVTHELQTELELKNLRSQSAAKSPRSTGSAKSRDLEELRGVELAERLGCVKLNPN